MTLSFSQQTNGNPNYFVEKIWASIKQEPVTYQLGNYLHSPYSTGVSILDVKPKLHTIRKDPKLRWKVGSKIHMVINNRSKNRLQFAPVLEVKKVWSVGFIHHERKVLIMHNTDPYRYKLLSIEETEEFAVNDGFNNAAEMFDFFKNEHKRMQLITWLDNVEYLK